MSTEQERFQIPSITFRLEMPIPQSEMDSLVHRIIDLNPPGNLTYVGNQVFFNRDADKLNGSFLVVHWHPDSAIDEEEKKHQYYECFARIHDFLAATEMLSS